jgi:hypothetical protein
VNATISPMVGAVGSFWIVSQPASQYTNAGVMLKIEPMIMKNQRPTMAWRICNAASLAFRPRNRPIDASCWPNVLDSRIPLTLSVSSVSADISASDFWVSVDTSRRTLPTRYVRYMKNGSRPSDRTVSRQSMRTIAMTVLIAIARLLVTELAVSVTTDWTPPTSLARRLWISPVRVSVKKRRGIDCRCA